MKSINHHARRHVLLRGYRDLFQSDLIEMRGYKNVNGAYKYIITVIDCFSKYGFALPLYSKRGTEVAVALKLILVSEEKPFLKPPKYMQTDLGKKFYAKPVQNLFESFNIKHYSTFSTCKASVVERFKRNNKH